MEIKYAKDTSKTNEDIEPKFGVWYPIESAPKDKRILIVESNGDISAAYYSNFEKVWYIPREDDRKCYDACFGDQLYTATLDPIYWMPLPNKPE